MAANKRVFKGRADSLTDSDEGLRDSPSFLLASLFAAHKAGDATLKRHFLSTLGRLGIVVRFASSLKDRNLFAQKGVRHGD
ncbi:MAG: hypothetical protein K1X57_10555 [Gemmataceae bacterium]|nr:hypothetical protein [Gemmataceae bacterium]